MSGDSPLQRRPGQLFRSNKAHGRAPCSVRPSKAPGEVEVSPANTFPQIQETRGVARRLRLIFSDLFALPWVDRFNGLFALACDETA